MGGPFDLWVQDLGVAARESLKRSVDPRPLKTRLQHKRHMISGKKSNFTNGQPAIDPRCIHDQN
jgi:hypothetical protein